MLTYPRLAQAALNKQIDLDDPGAVPPVASQQGLLKPGGPLQLRNHLN